MTLHTIWVNPESDPDDRTYHVGQRFENGRDCIALTLTSVRDAVQMASFLNGNPNALGLTETAEADLSSAIDSVVDP